MFGMSSTDFWENDPQLYWAYRTFYLKKRELDTEDTKYSAWLDGNMQSMGVSVALKNAFGKGEPVSFPNYDETFAPVPKEELSPEEEFIYWARK